jgi:hypothetical protein
MAYKNGVASRVMMFLQFYEIHLWVKRTLGQTEHWNIRL